MRATLGRAVFALLVTGAAPAAGQQRAGGPVLTLDAAVTGMFDRNIGRDRAGLDGYGGGGELLLRLASTPSRPLLQLEYAASLRRTSEVNPADGTGHRVSGLAGVPFARWLRLDVVGRAGRGGVDDDLVPTNELMLLGRLELQPAGSSRLRSYGARRWREPPPPGVAPTLDQYAGIELRQRVGGSTTALLDARYEESHPPDTTRFWRRGAATLGVAQHVGRRTAFEVEVRRRQRLYPRRMVEVDDEVEPRRDDDWLLGVALVYDDGRGTELRLEAEQDDRASNDPLRSYDAGRINLTLRRRVLGLGGVQPPPRIDEKAATAALRAHSEAAASEAPAFTAMAVGGTGVCALGRARAAVCWPVSSATPTRAIGTVTGSWTHVAAGPGRACALDRSGAAYCWRWHDGAHAATAATVVTPAEPVRTQLRFITLSVGGGHACGVTADGVAYCWGDNAEGQLGNGTAVPSPTPVRVAARVTFRSISAGGRHTCAVTTEDAAYCWGANESSQSAAGAAPRMLAPRLIDGFRFVQLSAGTRHTCALTGDGRVWCWGDNAGGQAGQPGGGPVVQPWQVQTAATFRDIGAGWAHSCALDNAGRVWCWGRNSYGQLGTGSADDQPHAEPRQVASERAFSALSVSFRTCALDLRQTVYCWGAGLAMDSAGTAFAPAPLRLPSRRPRR